MASILETSVLNYLSTVVSSFHKCLRALSFQEESVSCENIDNLMTQVRGASAIAHNVINYKKTADALILDIKKEGLSVDPEFFPKVVQFEKEIEKLNDDYNNSYTVLRIKMKELMAKYEKKLSEFSKISKNIKKENHNSFYHLSEMLDISV